MSLPTANDVQPIDPILTNLLVGYMQDDSRFIADRAFPGVPVPKDSGTYFIFTKKYWFLDEMEVRAYGGEFPVGGFGVETSTFATLQYALSKVIADEELANSQVPMDLEQAALRWLAQQNLIRKERAFAADFMKTSVWGTDKTVAAKWSDYSASDPVADILEGKRTISQNTGLEANTAVMGLIVRDRLVNHPDLIDRIKYSQAVSVAGMDNALSAVLDIPRILVGRATYNSANESASGTYATIVDDDLLLSYSAGAPGMLEPSAGYTFHWQPGGGQGAIWPSYRENSRHADVIQMKAQWDQKAVATDCGYFFADVVD